MKNDEHDQNLICPRWEEAIIQVEHLPEMSFESLQELTIQQIQNQYQQKLHLNGKQSFTDK